MAKLKVIRTRITSEPFDNKHVMKIYEKYLQDVLFEIDSEGLGKEAMVIDVFARSQNFAKITNDLNPEFKTTYNMEANDCLEMLHSRFGDESVDIIVFDPPYSSTLAKKYYDGIGVDMAYWQTTSPWKRAKIAAAKLIKVGGYFIHLGYHTKALGTSRGFELIDGLVLTNVGIPEQNDIILVVEKKMQKNLSAWVTTEGYEEDGC